MQSLAIRHDLSVGVLAANPTRYAAIGRYIHILAVPGGTSFNLRIDSTSDTSRTITAPTSFHLDNGGSFTAIYIDNAAQSGTVLIEVSDTLCLSVNGGGSVTVSGSVAVTSGSITVTGATITPTRHPIADLTIAAAGTDSASVPVADLDACSAFTIAAPAVLDATVFSVEVQAKAGGVWNILQSNGADITIAAGKTISIVRNTGFAGLRIHTTAGVAADRTFQISGSAGA